MPAAFFSDYGMMRKATSDGFHYRRFTQLIHFEFDIMAPNLMEFIFFPEVGQLDVPGSPGCTVGGIADVVDNLIRYRVVDWPHSSIRRGWHRHPAYPPRRG